MNRWSVGIACGVAACSHGYLPDPGPLAGRQEPAACATPAIYLTIRHASADLPALATFDPATGAVTTLGTFVCDQITDQPQWLAVDHAGVVYAGFPSCGGEQWLFRVDPVTLRCDITPFRLPTSTFKTSNCLSSIAFAPDATSATGETLYFVGTEELDMQTLYLGAADPETSIARRIADVMAGAEIVDSAGYGFGGTPLAATPDGTLHITYAQTTIGTGSVIDTLDTTTGGATTQWFVSTVPNATTTVRRFVAWGGDYYFFDAPTTASMTQVVRFRPADGSVTTIAQVAGNVSTVATSICAPSS